MMGYLPKVLTSLSPRAEGTANRRITNIEPQNVEVSLSIKLAAFHVSNWTDTRHLKPSSSDNMLSDKGPKGSIT